jgi:hypothetical protein
VAHLISALPVRLFDIDLDLIRQAAVYNATRKMSCADSIAAVFVRLRKAELVTGDDDFKQLKGEINILWISYLVEFWS